MFGRTQNLEIFLSRLVSFQISIVSQEPILFNCSVEENIAYGFDGEASFTDIENAAVSTLQVSFFLHFLLCSLAHRAIQ